MPNSGLSPRVRGNLANGIVGDAGQGLSPRVRGNPDRGQDDVPRTRSIPACAGEPPCRVTPRGCVTVYPRVCGGTASAVMSRYARIGLSPRVRGNLSGRLWQAWQRRSIPACAGEPLRTNWKMRAKQVYPRVCGGTCPAAQRPGKHYGLSPRVRGNHTGLGTDVAHQGSIPACAGEPALPLFVMVMVRVYPRVCGGTLPSSTLRASPVGLSPRVRGNHIPDDLAADNERSIPACAGEPAQPCSILWHRPCLPRVQVMSCAKGLGMHGLSKSYSSRKVPGRRDRITPS